MSVKYQFHCDSCTIMQITDSRETPTGWHKLYGQNEDRQIVKFHLCKQCIERIFPTHITPIEDLNVQEVP
jgi:hypothetical protein